MWPSSYWPSSYWSDSYWPKTGSSVVPPPPGAPDSGGGLFVYDFETDSTGAVDSVPNWVISALPKPPEQVISSVTLFGSSRTLNVRGSAGNVAGATVGGVKTILLGLEPGTGIVVDPGSSDTRGSFSLKGDSTNSKNIQGGV